jgi:hypothetical protein
MLSVRFYMVFLALAPVTFAAAQTRCVSNPEISKIYQAAQKDWAIKDIHHFDYRPVLARDTVRIAEIKDIQSSGGICTADDYILAARVTGFGFSIPDYVETIQLASTAKSLAPNSLEAIRLFAGSLDRLLIRMSAKQLYGTMGGRANGADKVPVLDGGIEKADIDALKLDASSPPLFAPDLFGQGNSSTGKQMQK